MFLKYIKGFILKKTLKKSLFDVKGATLKSTVAKVGLIVDETNFKNTALLKEEIISNGILESDIKIIAFSNNGNKNEVTLNPVIVYKDLNLKGEFIGQSVKYFLEQEFDLLINYYEDQKPILMLLTNQTRAKFKVGFSSVDKRLNHFLINIDSENYKGFISELFRYLKILNKI